MATVDFLGALGAGSDIDSKSLVESLVAAERAPKEAALNAKVDKADLKISAYGQVLSSLSSLSTTFSGLNDADDFNDYTLNVSGALTSAGSTAYSVSGTADVTAGLTELGVTSVATKDRWVSDRGYAATTTSINGGSTITLGITIGSTTTNVTVATATPQGIVDAVNAANLGIDASLVNTGASSDPYKILFEGQLGAANAFTVTDDATSGTVLNMTSRLSTASNAELVVNGVAVERSTNTINDVVTGMTLSLAGATASTSVISVARDLTGAESRIRALVDAYNVMEASFDNLTDPESTAELGGIFSGDTSFRVIRDRVKSLFLDQSSTATSNLSYLNDIGITFTRSGTLEIDDDRLTAALNNNFADVVSIFSADTNNQTNFGEANRGIAGDAIVTLNDMMAQDGTIVTQTTALSNRVDEYRDDLADLDRRMTQIYNRYLGQFTAMETAIDEMNSLRDYLKNQLESLPLTNKNK
ncbi:MAG TPA: hypothetical protein DIC49_03560 [Gammaproteobacteria bacterium]|nr:hypothetical protein [Gammaproteobacteria bacterium]|tara:strand:- start:178 stop:1596 length:1419 start_codon:yes stop_codon:yes gene_type:complete